MRFEWDEEKNARNVRKHGIDFELACEVFTDPLAVYEQDRFVDGEERWSVMGNAGRHSLYVAFTTTDEGGEEFVRIISARRTNRQERRILERGA